MNEVEGTEEEKPKSLIDWFWWIIPPVFLTFVYWPFLYGGLSGNYIRALRYLFIGDMDVGAPMFYWSYFLFGFMAFGMLLARKWSFMSLRIIVPILFGVWGHFVGVYYAMITSDFFLK